jgi:hypothetical protein
VISQSEVPLASLSPNLLAPSLETRRAEILPIAGPWAAASWLIRDASWMDSPREISRWDSDLRLSSNLHALELAYKRFTSALTAFD